MGFGGEVYREVEATCNRTEQVEADGATLYTVVRYNPVKIKVSQLLTFFPQPTGGVEGPLERPNGLHHLPYPRTCLP